MNRMRLKIALFTLIEVGAVSALLLDTPWIYLLVGLGFLAEHVVSWNARRINRGLFELEGAPLVKLVTVAAVEGAVWIVWIWFVGAGREWAAAAVLVGGLLAGHVLERNTSAGLPLLRDVARRVRESWDFTIVEAIAGIGWLALLVINGLVAVLVLFAFLFAEHTISTRRSVET